MNDLSIEYLYTLDEAIYGIVEINRSLSKFHELAPWLGFILLVLSFVVILPSDSGFPVFVAIFIAGAWLASRPIISNFINRRYARKIPEIDQTICWKVNLEWLHISTEDSESRFAWSSLIKVRERKKGFLLFTQPRLAYWIPKHGFNDESDIERFRSMLKAKSFQE